MLTLFRDIPFLSDIYRHLRAIRQLFAASTVTPMGFEFVGNQEQLENRYETPVADFLVARHARYRTFVNIGANIGYWPVFLRAVGFSNSILAIEPDKYNFSLLRRNINRNKLRNVDSSSTVMDSSNYTVLEQASRLLKVGLVGIQSESKALQFKNLMISLLPCGLLD